MKRGTIGYYKVYWGGAGGCPQRKICDLRSAKKSCMKNQVCTSRDLQHHFHLSVSPCVMLSMPGPTRHRPVPLLGFNMRFFDRLEIVDFGGLGGPGRPGTLPRRWGASPPIFVGRFPAAGGRPNPQNQRSPVGQKIMYEKPRCVLQGAYSTTSPSLGVPLCYAFDAWANLASTTPTPGF